MRPVNQTSALLWETLVGAWPGLAWPFLEICWYRVLGIKLAGPSGFCWPSTYLQYLLYLQQIWTSETPTLPWKGKCRNTTVSMSKMAWCTRSYLHTYISAYIPTTGESGYRGKNDRSTLPQSLFFLPRIRFRSHVHTCSYMLIREEITQIHSFSVNNPDKAPHPFVPKYQIPQIPSRTRLSRRSQLPRIGHTDHAKPEVTELTAPQPRPQGGTSFLEWMAAPRHLSPLRALCGSHCVCVREMVGTGFSCTSA